MKYLTTLALVILLGCSRGVYKNVVIIDDKQGLYTHTLYSKDSMSVTILPGSVYITNEINPWTMWVASENRKDIKKLIDTWK